MAASSFALPDGAPIGTWTFVLLNGSSGAALQSGGVANLGLSIVGNATGLKPGGLRTFSDNYQAMPAWSADPGPTSANIQYTAILQ